MLINFAVSEARPEGCAAILSKFNFPGLIVGKQLYKPRVAGALVTALTYPFQFRCRFHDTIHAGSFLWAGKRESYVYIYK